MTGVSAELLITVAVLILAAVATGTLAGRLFLAASRARPRAFEKHGARARVIFIRFSGHSARH